MIDKKPEKAASVKTEQDDETPSSQESVSRASAKENSDPVQGQQARCLKVASCG